VTDHTPLGGYHPPGTTPAERAAAVAAILAAGLLRHFHPAAFSPPAGITNPQEKPGESA
jgi:hypothetical protein